MCRLDQDGWPVVAVAAEGMTHNGKQVLKFRSGAFVLGKPVLPVCISYRRAPVNPAWTIQSISWQIIRMLTQLVNVANVDILPAHMPTAEEKRDSHFFAENVRASMVRNARCGLRFTLSGLPPTNTTVPAMCFLWDAVSRVLRCTMLARPVRNARLGLNCCDS
jgi:hypothetical protein